MVTVSVPLVAMPSHAVEVSDGYAYTVDGSGNATLAVVVDYGLFDATSIIIPEAVGGHPVTVLGSSLFQDCRAQSVVFPSTLVKIKSFAFDSCALTEVTFPANMETLGNDSFAYNKIHSITFTGNPPINVDNTVFADQITGQTRVFVLDEFASVNNPWHGFPVTWISPFQTQPHPTNANELEVTGYLGRAPATLMIPATLDGKTVSAIANEAFRNIPLSAVVLPNTITSIGDRAFAVTGLSAVTLSNNLESIGDSAFMGSFDVSNNLTMLTIPASVANIGSYAFGFNPFLERVTLVGNSPTNLGTSIFFFSGTPLSRAYTYSDTTGYGDHFDSFELVITERPVISSDASLSALTASVGSVSPVFSPSTLQYSISVSNQVTSIRMRPTVAESHATITVNGLAATSGDLAQNVTLAEGNNSISIVVTAQNNSTNTYAITVVREAAPLSNNASLSSDTFFENSTRNSNVVSTLSPTLSSQVYSISVPYATNQVRVSPVVAESHATVKVNGSTAVSGARTDWIVLSAGINNIPIVVTAQNGTSTLTYTLRITRAAPSSIATLSGLATNVGSLSPVFSSSVVTYSVTGVQNNNARFKLTPSLTDSKATVRVGEQVIALNGRSNDIELTENVSLTVPMVVTAEDGVTTKTYNVTIRRPPLVVISHDAALTSLTASGVDLSGTLSDGNLRASVPNSKSSVVLSMTRSNARSTIKINGTTISGNTSATISLAAGTNTPITVVVTAEDGTTKKSYSINITRAATIKPTQKSGISLQIRSGATSVGSTFGFTTPEWNGSAITRTEVKWFRCKSQVTDVAKALPSPSNCSVIPQANSSTYKLTNADRGKYVLVAVTVSNSAGEAITSSTSTRKIA